jgi:uncharacterized protein involved in exopolysaccharide biosynthesis
LGVELQGVQTSADRAQENELSLKAELSAAESSEASLRAGLRREGQGSGAIVADSGRVLKTKSEVLEEQLRALRLKYTADYPEVQAVERELKETRQLEAAESVVVLTSGSGASGAGGGTDISNQRPAVVSPELIQSKERIATLRAQIEIAKHQIVTLEKQREGLAAAISDCRARINRLPLVEQEMAGLKRNYEESANNYNSLLQKKLAAGVATDMEHLQKSERFTVIDPARIPQKPVKPNRPVLAAVGSLAGLVIGLLLGFALEYRKHTFLGEWELPMGAVVLGRVPLIEMTARGVKPARNLSMSRVICCFAVLHTVLKIWSSRAI